jgi:Mrp family chromosome partitioning ATPase
VSDVLLSGAPLTPIEVQPRLWFIPGGSSQVDSAHVVTSEVMKRVLEQACRDFDWILLDTPPVRVLPDAHLLLASVDAALLVVHAGKTPYDACRPATEILSESGKLLGVVLNRGQRRRSSPYDYAYGGQRTR